MDLSQLLKGKKAKPEETPAPPPAGSSPPPEVPPEAAPPPEKKPTTFTAFQQPGARYQLHRDVPTVEDLDQARGLYAELIGLIRALFREFKSDPKIDDKHLVPLRSLGARLLPALKASPNAFLVYFPRGTADDYLIAKSANAAVLASRLGQQMGLADPEISSLFLGGCLHDIGLASMKRLDLEPRVLKPEEKAHMRRHCEESLPFLLGDIPERKALVEMCLYHHERLDGSGYPKGLRGGAIPPAARILAVAETYEALTHARPYRERTLASEAMKSIIDDGGRLFDEAVIKALIRALSVYPPGSYVELNSSAVARVVGVNPDLPTRPLLLPVYDASGQSLEAPGFLDLSATPLVRIQRAVDESVLQLADPKEQLALRTQRWWTL